jgi:hypothetical protein
MESIIKKLTDLFNSNEAIKLKGYNTKPFKDSLDGGFTDLEETIEDVHEPSVREFIKEERLGWMARTLTFTCTVHLTKKEMEKLWVKYLESNRYDY